MIDATRLRLRADVPVGAYLSGGLDSGVTTALIRRYGPASLTTFSVAFEDPEFDESAHQRELVRYLGTRHYEMRCTAQQIADCFPQVIWHTEKPVLRTAPAPLFLLAQAVQNEGYKVVLTGEGADEVLGGYDIFKETKIRRFSSAHPQSQMRPLLLRRLYPYLTRIQAQSDAYRKAFFNVEADTEGPFYSHIPRWELTSRLKMFFSEGVRNQLHRTTGNYEVVRTALPARYTDWHWFHKAQYLETALLLPGYILASQGDRVAMAHAVEGRYPFLDHRVVEFAASIPPALKMRVLNEKYLLKRIATGLLPAGVRQRTKQPYRAPEAATLFRGRSGYARELLSPERIRRDGLFEPAMVEKLLAKTGQGKAQGIKDNMALAGIVSTALLIDQFSTSFSRNVS
jgi:asparagine synthase (glutamine-hydrolysing)